jgi:hypothetical protein
MFDTVEIRLHNINLKYQSVLEYIINNHVQKSARFQTYLTNEELQQFKEYPQFIRTIQNGKNNSTSTQKYDIFVPSSHYHIATCYNSSRDFLMFNVSIPKYLYGNNIAQYLDSVLNRDFSLFDASKLDFHKKKLYSKLVNFINLFFKSEFPGNDFDWQDIEIYRFDICYNQIFNTKEDALKYLDYQKKLSKRHERQSSDIIRDFKTSIDYKGKLFYYKIYHKGSEYETVGDKKEHKKVNANLLKEIDKIKEQSPEKYEFLKNDLNFRKEFFDIDYLQKLSDRILRYEISLTKNFFSYYLFTKTYGKNMSGRIIGEKTKKYNNDEFVEYRQRFESLWKLSKQGTELHKLPQKDRMFFKEFRRISEKKYSFHFKLSQDENVRFLGLKRFNPLQTTRMILDDKMIEFCFDYFMKMIKSFQLSEKPKMDAFIEALDDYNNSKGEIRIRFDDVLKGGFVDKKEYSKRFKAINKNIMVQFYMNLEKYSYDELRKLGLFADRTLRRYKADYEKIMGNVNSFSFTFALPKMSFESYYTEEICNIKRLKPNFYKLEH